MAHRIVILEQTPAKDVWAFNHVEQDETVARAFLASMRNTIQERNGVILFNVIIDLNGTAGG